MASKYPNKCKKCGGDLVFDPKTTSLKCQNCGDFVPLKLEIAEEKNYLESEINEQAWSNETKTIKCNSCGAIDVMNRGDMADVCPFCGSSNIIDSSENAGLIPNGIMPFSITKQEASLFFKNKVKKSIWAPNNFKKTVEFSKIKGIYTPVFSFDTIALGTYNGRLGKDEDMRKRNMDGSWSTETETRWFNVNGNINRKFDDTLVAAGQMINFETIEELEPFNTNASIKYDPLFLSGCTANSYKKDLRTSFSQATQMMKNELREKIIQKYDADRVANLNVDVDFTKTKYKYLLLPVYVSGYRYKDKNYNIYVNGTTGKVAGKLPVSRKKVWGAVLGTILAIGAVIAAFALL